MIAAVNFFDIFRIILLFSFGRRCSFLIVEVLVHGYSFEGLTHLRAKKLTTQRDRCC